MNIIMLAAGTSSRLGKENKLLLPYGGVPMVTHCCLEALKFLEKYSSENNVSCTLIVVTGYRRRSVEKALEPCKLFVGKTGASIKLLIVNNRNYRRGQFSSTKVGVAEVEESSPFFISLADMPLVSAGHYGKLVPLLGNHEAVRPFFESKEGKMPGHPVLHSYCLKERLLQCPDSCTVSKVLKSSDVFEPLFDNPSWVQDIDIIQDYESITNCPCGALSCTVSPSLKRP